MSTSKKISFAAPLVSLFAALLFISGCAGVPADHTIKPSAQTINLTLGTVTYGISPIALPASTPAGLPITYVVVSGPASVSSDVLTITGAGSVTVTASQAGNANFEAVSATVTFTVTKASLTVTANPASMVYGGTVPSLTYTITGFVNGDIQAAISGTPSLSAATISQAGTYPITITAGTLAAANYTFTFVNGTLTVGAAAQSITFGTLSNVTYGVNPITLGASASSTLPVNYTVSGAASLSGSILTITGVGTVSVTATQPGNTTYNPATPMTQSFTVNPAVLTATASDKSMVYGTGVPTLAYTLTGFVSGDTQATATTGAPTLSTTGTSTSPVSTYPITIAQGTLAAANYTFTLVNGTLTVTGGALQTITFGALTNQTYGVAPITLTGTASSTLPVSYTVTGVATINGSTLTVIGAGSVTVTANQAGNGTYAAAPSVPQTFTVAAAPLTATATSFSRVYGAANPVLAYTLAGFVNSDTQATAASGTPLLTTTATTTSAPAAYPITLTQGTLSAPNYTITFVNGTLTVGQAAQTITFGSLSDVQALTLIVPSASSTSSLPITLTSQTPTVCSTTQALTIGTCTIEADQAGNVNYSAATPVTQTFNVTGATQTITFPAPTSAFPLFQVTATTNDPNMTVVFSTSSTACQVSATGIVTEVLSGDCLINADSAADSIYAAATTATQDITIGQMLALISVSPSSTTLAPGATQQFTATASDQFNQPMQTTPTFTWATGSGAGVDQTGLYTAINSGDTTLSDTVTASVGAVTSNTAAVTLSPAAPILTIVNLSPQTPTINAPNGTANFSTTANDQFGRPYVPAPVCTYSSSNLSAATIGTNGQAVATNTSTIVQTTTITAVCGSFTEMTLLTVNPPPYIKTLTVAPVTVTAYSATSVLVTATDEYGNPFPISTGQITLDSFDSTYVSVAVASSPTAALSIGGNAAITSTPVTITVGGVSTTFNVTVTACLPSVCYTPVVTSIAVNAQDGTLDPMEFNGTQVLVASALDQHGANFSTTFTWTSNSSYLTVDVNGNVTAVGIGSGTISASAGGVTGTSAIIVITDAPYPSTPIITSLYPPMAVAKTYASSSQAGVQPHSTAIVVNGTGFLPGAVVCFGSDCGASYTTFKSSTKLVMLVPWQDLTTAGTVNVTVQDPALVGYTDQSSTVGEASAPSTFTLTTKGFVTITFDDGFSSGLTGTALFNAQGIKTTQFIITGNTCATIGTCASNGLRSDGYPWGWNGVGPDTGCPYASYKLPVTAAQISACSVGVGETGYISWANVATLAASGNEIAPHTRSHDEISYESAADVTGELAGALADLQYHAAPGHDTVAGYPITSVLAYPYGDYGCYASDPAFNSCVTGRLSDEAVGTQVKAAGYRGARTSDAALEGGLKFMESVPNGDDCSNDSCWSWGDQPLFLHTITADQTTGDTCSFAGGTSCDTSASNGAAPCMENGVKVTKPGFKCWVDNAVQTGTWVVLLFHRVDDNTGSDKGLSVNSTEIQSLALYLKAQGITTVTFRQGLAMEGIDGQYETVDSSGNIVSYPSPID